MISDLPAFYRMRYTTKEGDLTTEASYHNDQTFQVLNSIVSLMNTTVTSNIEVDKTVKNNGIKFPLKTTAEIATLQPDAEVGTIWFNTTLAKLQVKTAPGVVQTITST